MFVANGTGVKACNRASDAATPDSPRNHLSNSTSELFKDEFDAGGGDVRCPPTPDSVDIEFALVPQVKLSGRQTRYPPAMESFRLAENGYLGMPVCRSPRVARTLSPPAPSWVHPDKKTPRGKLLSNLSSLLYSHCGVHADGAGV